MGWSLPGSSVYGISQARIFTASDLASITSHIHSWVMFLLWLHPFILSGVISPLISSSILGTYRPGEFIFQCPIFLHFHTVHGVLMARILSGLSLPYSVHHILSDLSTMTRPSWVAPSINICCMNEYPEFETPSSGSSEDFEQLCVK